MEKGYILTYIIISQCKLAAPGILTHISKKKVFPGIAFLSSTLDQTTSNDKLWSKTKRGEGL
jgi:hypothetical protein